MVNKNEKRTANAEDLLAAARSGGLLPVSYPREGRPAFGKNVLYPGLYLMAAPTGGAKTITSIALATWIAMDSGYSKIPFLNILEPRSPNAGSDLSNRLLDSTLSFETLVGLLPKSGALVADSLTHVIPVIGTLKLGKGVSDTTFKGGVQRSWIVGCLALESAARKAGCTLIGTLNTDLFPGAEHMEGVCEGRMRIGAFGQFALRDRATRQSVNVTIPSDILGVASRALGYTGPTTSSSIIS